MAGQGELGAAWIPGVEVFPRRVFQQKGRGYFAELTRLSEGVLERIGLCPQQWAAAMMHRESAKGFHLHPPYVPAGEDPSRWFAALYLGAGDDGVARRPYEREQWDVMFFLTGICEMLLVDERAGLERRVMRMVIAGDSRPGPDNAAVVIPPGVAHALRNIGNEDLLMVYGTSTTFNPEWEGRIASEVEAAPLPASWERYLKRRS
jgi:dTDP-4-dehydrorhamnose 3,5-epimerase-like enzyme